MKSEAELQKSAVQFDALDITLGVQINSLKESEMRFLELISLLPQQNYLSDLTQYWKEI